MKARDIMTANPAVVTRDEPLSVAVRLMADLNVGMIPVVDSRATMWPVGVITDRDIVVRCLREGHRMDCAVQAHMTPRVIGVDPETAVPELVDRMERNQIRRLLVVDGGRLIGVIAQADVALKEGPLEPLKVVELLERVSAPPISRAH